MGQGVQREEGERRRSTPAVASAVSRRGGRAHPTRWRLSPPGEFGRARRCRNDGERAADLAVSRPFCPLFRRVVLIRRFGTVPYQSDTVRFSRRRTPVPERGRPGYDESSARRDHQASAAVIALSASRMPSPTSPAVAAQCRGTRARAPGSHRYSSRVNGSGAVLS
jgi:hypothetical protein